MNATTTSPTMWANTAAPAKLRINFNEWQLVDTKLSQLGAYHWSAADFASACTTIRVLYPHLCLADETEAARRRHAAGFLTLTR